MVVRLWEHRLLNMAGYNTRSFSKPVNSVSQGDNYLSQAYRFCSQIAKHNSNSFYMAKKSYVQSSHYAWTINYVIY